MKGFSFIRQVKLLDVCGRVNYISSHEEQEYLYATYETNAEPFWKDLARECQTEFKRSGTQGKCIEAREIIIALPRSLKGYEPNTLLKGFTDAFKEKYGVECSSALHHNSRRTNYHIHLIYAERKQLDDPVRKIATRNMFYDESGKRVRTKKEILDSKGVIKPGCYIIQKGEVYEQRMFTTKDDYFKSKEFVKAVKHMYTEMMNELAFPDERLKVFNPDSPYLATKKIGKNNPLANEIREDNKARDEWNRNVNSALNLGITVEAMNEMKRSEILEPLKISTDAVGLNHELFRQIVLRAAETARNYMRKFQLATPETRLNMLTTAIKDFIDRYRAPIRNRRIRDERDAR